DHSLPYTVAIGLMDGTVSPSSYAEARLKDEKTLALTRKITVKEDAALTALFPAKSATMLTIHLKSGKVITEKVEYPKGHSQNPVTDEEIESKFRQLAQRFLKEPEVDAIVDFVWTLDQQPSVTPLFESCVVS